MHASEWRYNLINSKSNLKPRVQETEDIVRNRYDSAIYTYNGRNFENKKVISSPILRETEIVGTVVASGDAQEKPTWTEGYSKQHVQGLPHLCLCLARRTRRHLLAKKHDTRSSESQPSFEGHAKKERGKKEMKHRNLSKRRAI